MKVNTDIKEIELSKLTNRDFVESFCHLWENVFGERIRQKQWNMLVKNASLSDHDKKIIEEKIFSKPYYQLSIFNKYNISKINIFVDFEKLEKTDLKYVLKNFYAEAVNRGLKLKMHYNLVNTNEFIEWCHELKNSPTFISEILANNNAGDNLHTFTYDFPVRKACTILKEKGYHTYWSSANVEDTQRERKGAIIPNKNVAFILIDPENLPENLKKLLYMGQNDWVWGNANEFKENERIYGIWAKLKPFPQEELCADISKKLEQQADYLPILTKTQDKKVECYREL